MKKNYLAPKSETLMAILREVCDSPMIPPEGGEQYLGSMSNTPGFAPRVGAPAAGHSL